MENVNNKNEIKFKLLFVLLYLINFIKGEHIGVPFLFGIISSLMQEEGRSKFISSILSVFGIILIIISLIEPIKSKLNSKMLTLFGIALMIPIYITFFSNIFFNSSVFTYLFNILIVYLAFLISKNELKKNSNL